ncbi:MAG: hypothetical protein AAFS04_02465 [Cyanobacteria bacterium J06631_9]
MVSNRLRYVFYVLASCLLFAAVTFSRDATGSVAQAQISPARNPDQVPTARYARGEEVDLSLIVEEWRDRYPATPVFACTCTAETCGDAELWPFRTYTLYQPFVALGDFNAAGYERNGFNCFDMETGDRPE